MSEKTQTTRLSDHCPVLSACDVIVLWPNGWMGQDVTWHGGRPRPSHIVLDGDPAPPKRGTAALQFSARVCCGQMVGWIKMPLGTKVGHIVLYGDPVPPNFQPMSIVAKRSPISDTAEHLSSILLTG